jgi:hypothetical protein
LLVSTRREASQKLRQAQKPENFYQLKQKEGANVARENFKAVISHFKESDHHLIAPSRYPELSKLYPMSSAKRKMNDTVRGRK